MSLYLSIHICFLIETEKHVVYVRDAACHILRVLQRKIQEEKEEQRHGSYYFHYITNILHIYTSFGSRSSTKN